MRPMSTPPSTAPVRLPMPPSTAAVKAIRPSWKPRSYRVVPIVCYVQQAGRAGHRAAEGEREGDGPVDVDAHQPGGVLVLRGGPHRLAAAGSW